MMPDKHPFLLKPNKDTALQLVDDWVAALRSGKYQQGQERLVSVDGKYCCLGVLCEVAGFAQSKNIEGELGFVFRSPELENEQDELYVEEAELEPSFRSRVGFSMNTEQELILMNDGVDGREQKPFPEIADYIEANLKNEVIRTWSYK